MGFNALDAAILEKAKRFHFHPQLHRVSDPDVFVMHIEVSDQVIGEDLDKLLGDTIMSSERAFNHGQSTTVWIEIKTDKIPDYVVGALQQCGHAGIGIVITHGASCSHNPNSGSALPDQLMQELSAALRHGRVWHPVVKQTVYARDLSLSPNSRVSDLA